jgi:hypothetical protein
MYDPCQYGTWLAGSGDLCVHTGAAFNRSCPHLVAGFLKGVVMGKLSRTPFFRGLHLAHLSRERDCATDVKDVLVTHLTAG